MNENQKVVVEVVAEAASVILFEPFNSTFFNEDFDTEEETEEKTYLMDYYENISHLSSNQFKENFRMFPDTFESVCKLLSEAEMNEDKLCRRSEIPIDKQLMVMLWYLANAESFRTVSSRFNLGRSSCFQILYRTCRRLLKINKENGIIQWPSENRQREISSGFSQFPGVIGAIDGCHFQISPPKNNHASYINRKGYHSVLLQGICDDRKKFIHCYIGEAGSVHDATVLKRSKILEEHFIDEEMHLLGDSAYPLSKLLLTPYKCNTRLTDAQKKYNKRLSSSRVRIENTFGILKARFRRLKLIENRRLDFIVILIMSCCILHNICMDFNDSVQVDVSENNNFDIPCNEVLTIEGRNKRDRICRNFENV